MKIGDPAPHIELDLTAPHEHLAELLPATLNA
jgi:hypothetical protein